MNGKVLIPLLTLLAFSSPVRAGDLWPLLGGGDTVLPGGDVVYVLRGNGSTSVNVALSFGPATGEGYTSLTLRAFKFSGSLTPAELTLFAGNVIRVAAECFNIDPARGPALQAWLLSNDAQEQNIYFTAGTRTAKQAFGPLRLELEKRSSARGHTVGVSLSRAGVPGVAPWVKSCLASG